MHCAPRFHLRAKVVTTFATLAAALLIVVPPAAECQVYKTVDKDGNVQYTSKPPKKGAKPAELPKIMRAEVRLTEKRLETCDKHGGVTAKRGLTRTARSSVTMDSPRRAPVSVLRAAPRNLRSQTYLS